MESSHNLKPGLSVIVPALYGYDSVLAALDSWEAQTCRSQLEILVMCPAAPSHPVPPGQIVVEIGSLQLNEARALGARTAAADYILFAEDHCLPDPDYAEAILERLQGPWDAVGPALRSGNPLWASTRGAFLFSYSQWMLRASGPIAFLPGHNSALRKQPLIALGPDLERELLVGAFLMQRLHSEGSRFFHEAKARMRHFDVPRWSTTIRIYYTVGQGTGAIRLKRASVFLRALYTLIIPVIAARHFGRALIQYLRAGPRAGFGLGTLAAGGFLACIFGYAEAVGAWKGVARLAPSLWIGEVKPVSREQVRVES